jgi:hypothetical protein
MALTNNVPQPAPIISKPPSVAFETARVAPPSPLYVTPEDTLLVRHIAFITGIILQLQFRILRADGQVITSQFDLQTPIERTVTPTFFNLPEGYLLSSTVSSPYVALQPGMIFAQIVLTRGTRFSVFAAQQLASGYVTFLRAISWPTGPQNTSAEGPGNIRSITGTNPAAGAEISETVPTNARWKLLAMTYSLVTSAAVATRTALLSVDDGGNVLTILPPAATQAASLSFRYNVGNLGIAVATDPAQIQVPISNNILLLPNWRLRTATTGLQAGDDYAAPQLYVEEWVYL